MTAHTDDGFHEIQLNGKQLVFLFMAATVVSVVIFLCGVLVGRGVRAERSGEAEAAQLSNVAEPATEAAAGTPAPLLPGSDPTAAAAPPAKDDLTFVNRLENEGAVKEDLKPQPSPALKPIERPAATAAPAAAPPVRAAATPPTPAEPAREPAKEAAKTPAPASAKTAAKEPAPAAASSASSEPAGTGFVVQIAALNIRSEADAIAKRLSSKGYQAYVMSPAVGTPQIYRVRIGKFGSRREAETIATKLQKEEQFNPWVTR